MGTRKRQSCKDAPALIKAATEVARNPLTGEVNEDTLISVLKKLRELPTGVLPGSGKDLKGLADKKYLK
jgi:hypothetical protein